MMDFSSKLNECRQKKGLQVTYEDVSAVGPDNSKTFTVRVVVDGTAYPDGEGKTKKEARQNAAKNALEGLGELTVPTTGAAEAPPVLGHPNYMAWLNAHRQKNKLQIKEVESTMLDPIKPFRCRFLIDDVEYPIGQGKTKKEAKEEAARLVHSAVHDSSRRTSEWSSVSGLSAVTQNGAAAESLASSSTLDSSDAESKATTAETTSDFIVFADPSTPLRAPVQLQTPDGKSKIKIAANFQNAIGKEGSNVEEKNKGGGSEKSRFRSDFDCLGCLGKGGYGSVYKVKEKALLKKEYAVKIVPYKKKSLREVLALSDLLHRNIVRYFTYWTEDAAYHWEGQTTSGSCPLAEKAEKYLYIQMELCSSGTLRSWIDDKVDQKVEDLKQREEALSKMLQILSGVEYIHSKNLVHRDLKPTNILFGLDNEVKIGDFGLVTDDDDDDERTMNRGTRHYMAPEQKDKVKYDRKVDIFSLGLIYFELLWSIPTKTERAEIWPEIRRKKLPQGFPTKFPEENRMIKSMLSETEEDRPEATELKTKLENLEKALTNVPEERQTF
ncbi:interferon-induced, double-stranded RNA-activated protein kinase-like isoform 2-T2 [Aulostomus maculatus]